MKGNPKNVIQPRDAKSRSLELNIWNNMVTTFSAQFEKQNYLVLIKWGGGGCGGIILAAGWVGGQVGGCLLDVCLRVCVKYCKTTY